MKNANYYYDLSSEEREKYHMNQEKIISEENNDLLKEMLKISKKILKKYKGDFYFHDINMIKTNEDLDFIWILRNQGTHMINLNSTEIIKDNINEKRWLPIILFKSIKINFKNELKGLYHIDGNEIIKLTEKKLNNLLEEKELLIKSKL